MILSLFTALAQEIEVETSDAIDPQFLLEKSIEIGTGILYAVIILVVGRIVAGWIEGLVHKGVEARAKDKALASFLGSIARYSVIAAAVIAALGSVGIETTSVMAIFASAGLAVGLALQGSLSNFAAGVMILFFKPFRLNDVITAAGETGRVDEIGLFATTLVNPSNHKIIIGNGSIIGGNITNFTALGTRRSTIGFGVAYGADIEQVCAVAKKAAATCPSVITDPAPPAVAFTDMAASSLNFACHVWSKAPDFLAAQHETRQAIYDALNAEGIEIPFDQIVVHQAPAV